MLVTEHGSDAVRMLTEEIALAVRAGDDDLVKALDAELQQAERLLEAGRR